jgi:hypothetical protein
VMRRMGKAKPLFRTAARTRSRASCTAVSGNPTTFNAGTQCTTTLPPRGRHGPSILWVVIALKHCRAVAIRQLKRAACSDALPSGHRRA